MQRCLRLDGAEVALTLIGHSASQIAFAAIENAEASQDFFNAINPFAPSSARSFQTSSNQLPIFPKRIKLLPVYAFVQLVDAMQVFDGIICKKLFIVSTAEE